jgi:hypothetical protein
MYLLNHLLLGICSNLIPIQIVPTEIESWVFSLPVYSLFIVQRLSVPLAIPAKPVETYLSLFHNA